MPEFYDPSTGEQVNSSGNAQNRSYFDEVIREPTNSNTNSSGSSNSSTSGTNTTTGSSTTRTVGSSHSDTSSRQHTLNTTPEILGVLNAFIQQLFQGGTPEQQMITQARQEEIARNRQQQGNYTPEAARATAEGLSSYFTRILTEQQLPGILRGAEGAGASKGTTRALLTQQAIARNAEGASKVGADLSVAYGGISNQLASVLEALTRQDPNGVAQQLIQAINTSRGLVQDVTNNSVTNTTQDQTASTTSSQTTRQTSSTSGSQSQNQNQAGSGGGSNSSRNYVNPTPITGGGRSTMPNDSQGFENLDRSTVINEGTGPGTVQLNNINPVLDDWNSPDYFTPVDGSGGSDYSGTYYDDYSFGDY